MEYIKHSVADKAIRSPLGTVRDLSLAVSILAPKEVMGTLERQKRSWQMLRLSHEFELGSNDMLFDGLVRRGGAHHTYRVGFPFRLR